MTEDYKLANLARQELKRQDLRQKILASTSETALDLIMEAPSPATLVQSFPDQDLYYLMHKTGVHDFLPVLAMASSAQWEYILDVEVWEDDRLDLHAMTQVFDLLFKADPKRLLRWGIMKKPEFMEFFLFHHVQVVIREHDEVPPEDFEDYITLDDKFYFRFPEKSAAGTGDDTGERLPSDAPEETFQHDEAPDLIESMLKTLAEMDLSVFHGLLLETLALLPSETEEEEFRLRNIRLAEKGFLPPHEAIGIYQPVASPRKRPGRSGPEKGFDPEQPMPPQFFTQFIQGDHLFVQALQLVGKAKALGGIGPDLTIIHSELAALINKIVSADRIKIRKTTDIRETMKKAGAYLSLGIEVLLEGDTNVERAADIIETYFIEDIFRTGAREGIRIKTRAMEWYATSFLKKNSLPLSFLGESYLGVLGGLFIDRPMFFANYAERELYRDFSSLKDIRSTGRLLDEILALDNFLDALNPDLSTFTEGVLTYKSMILTLWVKNRTGLAPGPQSQGPEGPGQETDPDSSLSLSPIPMACFVPFFSDLFTGSDPARIEDHKAKDLALWAAQTLGVDVVDLTGPLQSLLFSLIHELEEEYGTVERVDPRFMPHFLLIGGPDAEDAEDAEDPESGDPAG